MPKVAVEIDLKEIEKVINRLKTQDRISLVQRLEQKTWGERFRSLASKIDKRRKRYPLSQKELLNLVKEARRERYAAGRP